MYLNFQHYYCVRFDERSGYFDYQRKNVTTILNKQRDIVILCVNSNNQPVPTNNKPFVCINMKTMKVVQWGMEMDILLISTQISLIYVWWCFKAFILWHTFLRWYFKLSCILPKMSIVFSRKLNWKVGCFLRGININYICKLVLNTLRLGI